MADEQEHQTTLDRAIERMVSDSKRYAFAKAHWLPLILDTIKRGGAPEHYSTFKTYDLPWVADAVERLIHKVDTTQKADENMFFKTFASWSDPTVERKAGKECKYLNWICKNWVETPTAWEDLDIIRETLFHFDQMSGRLHKLGLPNQIDQIQGFGHLAEIMGPLISEKLNKNAESTLLYDGPEGKIIVPHTMAVAKHLGMQTKWCLSSRKSKNYFDVYNPDAPILFYFPVPDKNDKEAFPEYTSFKFAATGAELRDELDKSKVVLPTCLKTLVSAPDGSVSEYLQQFGKKHQILNSPSEIPNRVPKANKVSNNFRI